MLCLALCVLLVYAALDEVLQGFVPGRQPDRTDFLADAAGILTLLLGVGAVRLYQAKVKR